MPKSRLYLGNVPYTLTPDAVVEWLHPVPATDIKIVTDHDTGKPRGFAFVNVESDDVEALIARLDGSDLGGRPVRVNVANDKPQAAGRGRGRGREQRSR